MTDQSTLPKKILVIEDDQFIRELYIDILLDEGYNVEHAVDGEEGYQKMHAGGYDLVLLDIMLPKMDGIKILDKLKNETPPVIPNAAVLVLSNLGQETIIGNAISLGARGYLIKSDHTPDQVIQKVKECLAPNS
jgi:two-component system, cell cycle response regulator